MPAGSPSLPPFLGRLRLHIVGINIQQAALLVGSVKLEEAAFISLGLRR
jgi:hypothetical protein